MSASYTLLDPSGIKGRFSFGKNTPITLISNVYNNNEILRDAATRYTSETMAMTVYLTADGTWSDEKAQSGFISYTYQDLSATLKYKGNDNGIDVYTLSDFKIKKIIMERYF